ncbi:tail fiber domain-containing protein [Candidatus Woesearchaeota archaeon]|nr:tail fiber domain-containing protein [Candidatus Woesearchaeota archaeon]
MKIASKKIVNFSVFLKLNIVAFLLVALISRAAYAGDVTVASGDTDFQKDNEVYLSIKNTEIGGKDWRLVSAGTAGSIGVGKFSIYEALAGQSRLTIDGGSVGIGTTSPGANKLDVAGNIHATADICTDAGGGKCLSTAGGGESAAGWTDDGSNVRLTASTDKVGIGTSTPGSELEVSGQFKISSGINDKIVLAGTQANPHTIYLDNSKGVRFWDNVNNEIFRIANTGDVSWIGSLTSGSVPWPRVTGFTGDSTSDSIADDGVISDNEASDVLTINNGLLYAPTSGNVGIGTTGPGYKLQVAGDVGATAYYYTSDEQLKKDIEKTNGLEIINKLHGVLFTWKDSNKRSAGLIAQNVEKAFPVAVSTDSSTGMKSLNYGALTAPIVESIKELDQKTAEHDKKIAQLESEIGALKQEIESLRQYER